MVRRAIPIARRAFSFLASKKRERLEALLVLVELSEQLFEIFLGHLYRVVPRIHAVDAIEVAGIQGTLRIGRYFSNVGELMDDRAHAVDLRVIDLTTEVSPYRDRGLLGLAIHPDFPTIAEIYVLYTYDAPPGGTAPGWNDQCPGPPDGLVDGCVARGAVTQEIRKGAVG